LAAVASRMRMWLLVAVWLGSLGWVVGVSANDRAAAPCAKQASPLVKAGRPIAVRLDRSVLPGRLLRSRCGIFPLRLRRNGKLVVKGRCYIHAVEYEHVVAIDSEVVDASVKLPRGRWEIHSSYKSTAAGGFGRRLVPDRVFRGPGTVTVQGRLPRGGELAPYPPPIRGRLACGLYVRKPGFPPPPQRPKLFVYATVIWPQMRFLGNNVPVRNGEPLVP
jgi:hypothetical protein